MNKTKLIGRVKLFENKRKKSEKDAVFSGYVQTPKGKYTITLWEETSDMGSTYWSGKIEEKL